MTRQQQRPEELRHVTKMIDLLGIDLSNPPSPYDPPVPDYKLIHADGRLIGLEVTEARDNDVTAAWKGTLEQLHAQIKKTLERAGAMARRERAGVRRTWQPRGSERELEAEPGGVAGDPDGIRTRVTSVKG